MAIDSRNFLGTYMGHPVKRHDGVSKPVIGDMVHCVETMRMMIYDGKEWKEIAGEMETIPADWSQYFREPEPVITDEFLEDEHPELKKLKEEYEEMRDKLKTFEILKIDNGS